MSGGFARAPRRYQERLDDTMDSRASRVVDGEKQNGPFAKDTALVLRERPADAPHPCAGYGSHGRGGDDRAQARVEVVP